MKDRAFCFLLGAGASVTSGIKTGTQLVDRWLAEMCIRLDTSPDKDRPERIESWATAENLGIPDFEYSQRAEFYPYIFQRRFPEPEEGYAYLEAQMEDAEPSLGYSYLAQILADTRHRVVITTNFDDLVAHSLFMYPERRTAPLVYGHESPTPFVRAQLRRPLVAKIHNNLLLARKNEQIETRKLAPEWETALKQLFRRYTPIVIGYGGNDGSLMGFLESLLTGAVAGRMVWCYVGEKPRWQIRRVVAQHHGVLVKIDGFDQLLVQLGNKLGYGTLTDKIRQRNDELLKEYSRQYASYQRRIARIEWPPELQHEVKGFEWWKWIWLAEQPPSPEAPGESPHAPDKWYEYGIQEFPESLHLRGNYAVYLQQAGKDGEAQKHFHDAIECAHAAGDERFGQLTKQTWPEFKRLILRDNEEARQRFFRSSDAEKLEEKFVRILKDFDAGGTQEVRKTGLKENDPALLAKIVGLLLKSGDADSANDVARRTWELKPGSPSQFVAEMAFYQGVLARLQSLNDRQALGRLKWLFEAGYERSPASLGGILAAYDQFPKDALPLYQAIAAAIGDAGETGKFEGNAEWKEIEPVPIDAPWPEKAEESSDQTSETKANREASAGRKGPKKSKAKPTAGQSGGD